VWVRNLGMLLGFAALVTTALAQRAFAAPKADLVVVWAPGLRTAPVEAAAKRAGAAVIDTSPKPAGAAATAQLVAAGVQAYEGLEFDKAWQNLERARSEADRTGADGLTQAQLSDLFLYRALVRSQQGDDANGWEELVAANTIDPTRELDPGRFPPRVRSDFERARETVKTKPRGKLTVQAPEGCATNVDGRPAPGPIDLVVGQHWVSTRCPDRQPEGFRIELTGDVRLPVEPRPFLPPSDTELLVQARTVGARAFVAVEVRGGVATARLVGLDGRERDRRTIQINGDLAPLAEGIESLLAPPPERHWYRSRWVWAVGGAAVAAAILVPLTAALANDSDAGNPTARPMWPTADGQPPW
jgi:hypothetical protein